MTKFLRMVNNLILDESECQIVANNYKLAFCVWWLKLDYDHG